MSSDVTPPWTWRSNHRAVVSYAEPPPHRRVHVVTRRSHHLLTLSATLLAIAVAAGVATPRPRLGRERALRTVALAASTRPDQPCAWGPADEPEPDVTVAAGDAFASADRLVTPADAAAVLPGGRLAANAAAPPLTAAPDTVAAAAGARTGPPPGRAPPNVRS